MFACRRGACRDCWIVRRAIESHQRSRLSELRFGGLEVLVRDVDSLFESIQFWILKNLPPLAASDLIIGLSRFPIRRNFFIGGRTRSGWPGVTRADRTTGQQKQTHEKSPKSATGAGARTLAQKV